MDYEKAYKAVLKTATQWIKDGCTDKEKICLECVFPELRESEDEQSRKKIEQLIRLNTSGAEKTQLLAYLEKQKEQVTDESDKIAAAYQLGRSDERKQKEQKPAEWSEEDEDMLNSCISSIEEAKENRYAYKETDGDTSYDHEIAWLKSLHPSWKPSEEQMDALKELIDDANRAGWVTPGATELYEQLKKL